MKNEKYIPALSYDWLTPFYDTAVRLTTREKIFKKALVEQAKIKAGHRILDLACGTERWLFLSKTRSRKPQSLALTAMLKFLRQPKQKRKNRALRLDLMKECRLICHTKTNRLTAWFRVCSFII